MAAFELDMTFGIRGQDMLTRRFLLTGLAAGSVSACARTGNIQNNGADIDQQVNIAIEDMYRRLPYTQELASRAFGLLVMPGVIKGGFIVGGAYGEGALRLPETGYQQTANFYSFSAASAGFQAGGQKTQHALFFMTEPSLTQFRGSQGWEVGADAEVTLLDGGVKADVNSTLAQQPVIGVIFGQQGLLAGVSLEGGKYSRVER